MGSKEYSFDFRRTLKFHDDPHGFIQSRVDDGFESLSRIQTNLLNREVTIVRDYGGVSRLCACEDFPISSGQERVSAKLAYDNLMPSFFPRPNIQLLDWHEAEWKRLRQGLDKICLFDEATDALFSQLLQHDIHEWTQVQDFDLYKAVKQLMRKFIALRFFGSDMVENHNPEAALKGMFSVPVNIKTRLYQSGFSKGVTANEELRKMASKSLHNGQCPFHKFNNMGLSNLELANHIVVFTSALVVKGISSLLTALILQATRLDKYQVEAILESETLLHSFITETSRLSPPIIGCMRKSVETRSDIWLSFVDANRDGSVYPDPDTFKSERFTQDFSDPLSFGFGPKKCLGHRLVIQTCKAALVHILKNFDICVKRPLDWSVEAWLGWRRDEGRGWPGVKQLPTQRPREPVFVSSNYK